MSAELHQYLRSRRSIRRFRPDPVAEQVLRRVLETATYAPSAHDKQPWRFVVMASKDGRNNLAKAVTEKFRLDMTCADTPEQEIDARIARTIRRIDEAPVIIILCREITRIDPQPDEASRQAEILMGKQSVAVAGLQLLLAAHAEDLGGTWICWPLFAAEEICSALDLPPTWEPQGMVFIGYPDESPAAPMRTPIQEIVTYL